MPAAKTRIYSVADKEGHTRLVRAVTTAQAMRHVAQAEYTVKVASQDELVALVADGVKVEDVGDKEDEGEE